MEPTHAEHIMSLKRQECRLEKSKPRLQLLLSMVKFNLLYHSIYNININCFVCIAIGSEGGWQCCQDGSPVRRVA